MGGKHSSISRDPPAEEIADGDSPMFADAEGGSLTNHLLIAMPQLSDVLSQMKLEPTSASIAAQPVLRGGPVHTDRGFVLHRPGGQWDHTHKVSDTIQVTTSRDVLAAMARGEGPSDAFIALGYAGWESGQLEREMKENAWASMPVDPRVVFELPFEQRWAGAWRLLGIDVDRLSPDAGHA